MLPTQYVAVLNPVWALMTFSVFLGALQIRRDLPGEWPAADTPAFAEYVKFLMVSLMPPELDGAEPEANTYSYIARERDGGKGAIGGEQNF